MLRQYDYQPMIEENYSNRFDRLYNTTAGIKGITFQVTEDCCLACTYCYQHNKSSKKMDFNLIKSTIDSLLNNQNIYINTENTKGLMIEFIGGEPLLEAQLIYDTIDYFLTQAIIKHHPWLFHTKFNICSNGLLYFTESAQNIFQNFAHLISFTISIDGNKELHDACRVDLHGNGTYDQVEKAVKHYMKNYSENISTKMTLFPQNISYLCDSIINLINIGYKQIWANCVFENVWQNKDAQLLYKELKKLADYLINNNLFDKIYIKLLDESDGNPLNENDNINFCGGHLNDIANMSIDPDGYVFPCIRYMNSSLNNRQQPLSFGSIHNGILITEEEKQNKKILSNITRRSMSTDECFYCPIASGCGGCIAFNYEEFGDPNKRTTYHCTTHKARILANIYYWNSIYKKLKLSKRKQILLPKDECLKIISKQEYDNLLKTLQ